MRLHFQEKPWDLFVAVGYTIVVATVLLVLNVGNPLAIILVFFVPGYVLVATLFPSRIKPEKPEIDWIERIALSISLTVAVVPLFGLLLNFTPFGIRFAPIVATITIFTIGVGYTAYWRRIRLPSEQRLSLTVEVGLLKWANYSAVDKGLTIALAASVVLAGGTLVFVVLTPLPGERLTEFYVLSPGGNASNHPTALNVSQPRTVIIGITNHEGSRVNYTVRVDLVGVRIVHNVTAGSNETVEINRTTLSTFNITLAESKNWTQPFTFRINYLGLWKIQFLLHKEGDFSPAYRELHFYVTVG